VNHTTVRWIIEAEIVIVKMEILVERMTPTLRAIGDGPVDGRGTRSPGRGDEITNRESQGEEGEKDKKGEREFVFHINPPIYY
jgi:hypothetical protein